MQYESPGDAFSSSLQDTMMAQATAKRQAMLDALAQKKDAHQFSMQEQELEVRRMEMQERAQERAAANEEKKAALADKQNEEANKASEKGRSDTVATLSRLVPGDVLSSDLVADVKKHNLTDLMKQQQMPIRLGQTSIPLEPAESQNMVNKGTPEQQIAAAKPPTARGVHVTFRDPKTGENMERWVSEEDAVKMGQMESPTQPKPEKPESQGNWSLHEVTGQDGKPRLVWGNNKTREVSEVSDGLKPKEPATVQKQHADNAKALKTLASLSNDIDEADRKGLIGPGAGRISSVEQMIGNPDPTISALGTRMRAAKMLIDSSMGGARAAASPALIKQWDAVMSLNQSKASLKASLQVMRELAGAEPAPQGKQPTHTVYGMDGKPVQP